MNLSIQTRHVLTEKAPCFARVKTNYTAFFMDVGSYFMVKPVESYKRLSFKNTKAFKIVDFGLKDFPANNPNDIGCFIGKSDLEFFYYYNQIEPITLDKGIREWPELKMIKKK